MVSPMGDQATAVTASVCPESDQIAPASLRFPTYTHDNQRGMEKRREGAWCA